ncbi:MAG: hypothetical protein QOF96_2189 [Actinomycetota bacterium]|nr:hypothetical protein [Actinomycetota bacterium]
MPDEVALPVRRQTPNGICISPPELPASALESGADLALGSFHKADGSCGYGGRLASSDTTSVGPGPTASARLASARQERRWESRRDLIVRAAVDVFAEMGLEGATLDAVGERVGLTKASLYYYVKSKEELLGHVIGHVLQAQEHAMAELTHDGMSPEERLRGFCLGHLRSLFGDPAGKIAAQVALSGNKDERVRSLFHDYMGGLDAILADGVAAGAFRPVDPGVARHSVLAALNAVTLWYVPEGPLTVDDVGNEICDLVIGGLRPPTSRRRGPADGPSPDPA